LDEAATALAERLRAARVHCEFEAVATHPTITKLRVLSRHQQLLRLDFEKPFAAADAARLLERARPAIAGVGALVLSDYAKGALADPQPLIQAARAAGVPVLVDPKGSDFSRYRGATLLTPNLPEFELIVGRCDDEAELVARGLKLVAELE